MDGGWAPRTTNGFLAPRSQPPHSTSEVAVGGGWAPRTADGFFTPRPQPPQSTSEVAVGGGWAPRANALAVQFQTQQHQHRSGAVTQEHGQQDHGERTTPGMSHRGSHHTSNVTTDCSTHDDARTPPPLAWVPSIAAGLVAIPTQSSDGCHGATTEQAHTHAFLLPQSAVAHTNVITQNTTTPHGFPPLDRSQLTARSLVDEHPPPNTTTVHAPPRSHTGPWAGHHRPMGADSLYTTEPIRNTPTIQQTHPTGGTSGTSTVGHGNRLGTEGEMRVRDGKNTSCRQSAESDGTKQPPLAASGGLWSSVPPHLHPGLGNPFPTRTECQIGKSAQS